MSIDFTMFTEHTSINYDQTKYTCKRLSDVPLYSHHSGKPVYTDIVQGYVGSCWFLSCLASYLRPSPELEGRTYDLMEMIDLFSTNGDRRLYKVYLDNKSFIVDDWVPKEYLKTTPSCIWPILFEKAMLSLMGVGKVRFDVDSRGNRCCRAIDNNLGEMNSAELGLSQLICSKATHRYLHSHDNFGNRFSGDRPITIEQMCALYDAGHHLLANTSMMTFARSDFPQMMNPAVYNALPTHCYAILSIVWNPTRKTYILTMYNPWGRKAIIDIDGAVHPHTCDDLACTGRSSDSGIFDISWERFHQIFACVHHTL